MLASVSRRCPEAGCEIYLTARKAEATLAKTKIFKRAKRRTNCKGWPDTKRQVQHIGQLWWPPSPINGTLLCNSAIPATWASFGVRSQPIRRRRAFWCLTRMDMTRPDSKIFWARVGVLKVCSIGATFVHVWHTATWA